MSVEFVGFFHFRYIWAIYPVLNCSRVKCAPFFCILLYCCNYYSCLSAFTFPVSFFNGFFLWLQAEILWISWWMQMHLESWPFTYSCLCYIVNCIILCHSKRCFSVHDFFSFCTYRAHWNSNPMLSVNLFSTLAAAFRQLMKKNYDPSPLILPSLTVISLNLCHLPGYSFCLLHCIISVGLF